MTDILCFGSAHIDKILTFYTEPTNGHSAPARSETCYGGVGQNMALALARLNNKVGVVSLLGQDAEGERVTKNLQDHDISTAGILTLPGHPTGSYVALHKGDGELCLAAADMDIYDELTPFMLKGIHAVLQDSKAWVIDCAFKPIVYSYLADCIGDLDLYATITSIPKAEKIRPILGKAKVLFGNVDEVTHLAGIDYQNDDDIWTAAKKLANDGIESVFVTLGSRGVYVLSKGERYARPPFPTKIKCVNGAGDAFAAGAINEMVNGNSIEEAMETGLAAASLCLEGLEITQGAIDARRGRSDETLRMAATA